jgi:hypothetical protein
VALHELERQTVRRLDALSEELHGRVDFGTVACVGQFHFDRLVRHATVTDYIPLLVYRCTKEDVLNGVRPRLESAA